MKEERRRKGGGGDAGKGIRSRRTQSKGERVYSGDIPINVDGLFIPKGARDFKRFREILHRPIEVCGRIEDNPQPSASLSLRVQLPGRQCNLVILLQELDRRRSVPLRLVRGRQVRACEPLRHSVLRLLADAQELVEVGRRQLVILQQQVRRSQQPVRLPLLLLVVDVYGRLEALLEVHDGTFDIPLLLQLLRQPPVCSDQVVPCLVGHLPPVGRDKVPVRLVVLYRLLELPHLLLGQPQHLVRLCLPRNIL
mmetsp:Transcript_11097/g.37686  ORF Transcript_11097/g.37686 Transcript_11097/m.37686 type:complete len:252 (+) Transcript_11097:429-1184(+)